MARRKQDNGRPAKISDNANLTADERFRLGGFVREIERLDAERIQVLEQIKEVYTEAAERGFDTIAIRHIIKLRRKDKAERDAFQVVVDSYMHALGNFASTELGQAMAPKPAEHGVVA